MGHPQPSEHEVGSNATFEALMWALSRPGQIRRLPEPGPEGIVDALIDRECRVFASDEKTVARAARAGAEIVAPNEADHVFAGDLSDASLLTRVPLGSDLHPENGATLVVNATFGTGEKLRLSGSGVDGAVTIAIGGLPSDFWARRRAVSRYPMGFELFLIDGHQVLGIPRSTQVERL